MKYCFYYDMRRCSGCKVCHIACRDKNRMNAPNLSLRKVESIEGGRFPDVWSYNLSYSCNHCEKALCIDKCPTGAMYRETKFGSVQWNKNKCISCHNCIRVCPYNAVHADKDRIVQKCDLCIDLLEKGQSPACVSACSTRSLKFMEKNKLGSLNKDAILEVKNYPGNKKYKPILYIKPTKEAKVKNGNKKIKNDKNFKKRSNNIEKNK